MIWTLNLTLLDPFFLNFHHWAFASWAGSNYVSTVCPPVFQKLKCKQCNEIYEKHIQTIHTKGYC